MSFACSAGLYAQTGPKAKGKDGVAMVDGTFEDAVSAAGATAREAA
jgi:hypothetical protein